MSMSDRAGRPAPGRLVVLNARVVDPARGVDAAGHLVADDGVVVSCGAGPVPQSLAQQGQAAVRRVDVLGAVLAPGLWDIHVHFREPGQEDKETVATGCAAAAAGGFTRVVTMPNTSPPIDNAGGVCLVLERARAAGLCRVHPAAAITQGLDGTQMCEYDELIAAGAVAFTDDGRWVADGAIMRRAMEYSRMLGVPLITHAQDRSLSRGGAMNEGAWSTRLGLRGIPRAAETVAVARDIELARLTGARLHVAHVSSKDVVELVRRAKHEGLAVTAETAPHFLDFTDAECAGYDTRFKMNPPLRAMHDQEALIEGLVDGTLEAIATDHAPHTVTEKERPFGEAPFGVIGLETSFAACHDRLVRRGPLTLPRLVELLTTGPARILGLPGASLAPGTPADFTLIDPGEQWTPREGDLKSKSRNCPWLGRSLTGRVIGTCLEGKTTYALRGRLEEAAIA
jgi:dihydroorotase